MVKIVFLCLILFVTSSSYAQKNNNIIRLFNQQVDSLIREPIYLNAKLSIQTVKRQGLTFNLYWISEKLDTSKSLPNIILRPNRDFSSSKLNFELHLPKNGILVFSIVDTDNEVYTLSKIYLSKKIKQLRLVVNEKQGRISGSFGCIGELPKNDFKVCQTL